MSWQAYVDTNLVGSKKVTQAAIIGLDGNAWAKSAGFNVTPAEGKAIVAGFTNPASLRATGLRAAGVKYMFLRDDPGRTLIGKKGAAGIHCTKTGKCVLVGVYKEGIAPGECAVVVEKLADYLVSVGY